MDPICEVCSISCGQSCVRCKQVYYCSKDHQKEDWKKHKVNCCPVKIIVNQETGARALEATRDIPRGEIILKEKPLLTGPKVDEDFTNGFSNKFPICLECYHVVQENYLCSKCRWPLCGPQCENGRTHSAFECRVFEKHHVQPIQKSEVSHYLSICILRGLLLKQVDPDKWTKLCSLDSKQLEREERHGPFHILFGPAVDFIWSECKQIQFDVKTMDFVAGALQLNRMSTEDTRNSPDQRLGSFVYHKPNFATHSCIPNAMWFIQKNQELHLRASVPIKCGELVTNSDVELGEETASRRAKLTLQFINCTCKRCEDPTELKTYMSAVKCHADTNSCDGYYLCTNPLAAGSELIWKCNECGKKEESHVIRSICDRVQEEYNGMQAEFESKARRDQGQGYGHDLSVHMQHLKAEERFLKKHMGRTLHKNHAILFRAKMQMTHRIPHITLYMENEVDRMVLEEKQVGWVRECLGLIDIFWPGLSRYRGQILYTLQRSQFCLIFTELERLNMSRRGPAYNSERVAALRLAFQEVLDIRKEVKVILGIETAGKVEREYADSMDSEGIDFAGVRNALGMPAQIAQ